MASKNCKEPELTVELQALACPNAVCSYLGDRGQNITNLRPVWVAEFSQCHLTSDLRGSDKFYYRL